MSVENLSKRARESAGRSFQRLGRQTLGPQQPRLQPGEFAGRHEIEHRRGPMFLAFQTQGVACRAQVAAHRFEQAGVLGLVCRLRERPYGRDARQDLGTQAAGEQGDHARDEARRFEQRGTGAPLNRLPVKFQRLAFQFVGAGLQCHPPGKLGERARAKDLDVVAEDVGHEELDDLPAAGGCALQRPIHAEKCAIFAQIVRRCLEHVCRRLGQPARRQRGVSGHGGFRVHRRLGVVAALQLGHGQGHLRVPRRRERQHGAVAPVAGVDNLVGIEPPVAAVTTALTSGQLADAAHETLVEVVVELLPACVGGAEVPMVLAEAEAFGLGRPHGGA